MKLLLEIFDQAFGQPSWHGTPLGGTLRGVTPRQALWRPRRGAHCIWELVLHTAYWKYIVRRRLTGDTTSSFPRGPSNFPALPDRPDARAWRRDVALLKEEHRRLRGAIAKFLAARLTKRDGSQWRFAQHIYGIASHDLYHAGQIQLLKRLQRR